MAYEGYIDAVDNHQISGWIYDDARRDEALTVEILVGERVIGTVRADGFRADLVAAGKGNGRHAFRYALGGSTTGGAMLAARVQGKRWHIQPTHSALGHPPPLQDDPRRRYQHTLEFGYPQVRTGFSAAMPSKDEPIIVGRIIEAFHRALKDNPEGTHRKNDVWSEIQGAQHREVLDLIRRRDAAGLANYLRDAHAKGLTVGITQGAEMTNVLRERPEARRAIATEYVDNLVSLAEFLAILKVEAPGQRGSWAENLHADPQALIDAIGKRVGFPIETPNVMSSYFGIDVRDGILTGRDLCALYAALQVRNIAADLGIERPVVCEIGGGLGGVAYYAARMGMKIAIVDLPLVGVLQAYFLLRALPDHDIQLYGEQESPATTVRLLPTFAFHGTEPKYDILLNQDSFPEMNVEYSLGYLRTASQNVRHAFYSINQEACAPRPGEPPQAAVPDLMEQAGGFRRSSRYRHWLRPGYVEEVYRKI
jgi:hypothetical protein